MAGGSWVPVEPTELRDPGKSVGDSYLMRAPVSRRQRGALPRFVGALVALGMAALVVALALWPATVARVPAGTGGLSFAETLSSLWSGAAGRPPTMLSIAVATFLAGVTAATVVAWLVVAVLATRGPLSVATVRPAKVLTWVMLLGLFALFSAFGLVAPWLGAVGADRLTVAALLVAAGLAAVRVARGWMSGDSPSGLRGGALILLVAAVWAAIAGSSVWVAGFGPSGRTFVSLLDLPTAGIVAGEMVALSAAAGLASRGEGARGLRAASAAAMLVAVGALVTVGVRAGCLNPAFHANAGTDGLPWVPYLPANPFTVVALLPTLALVGVAGRRRRNSRTGVRA